MKKSEELEGLIGELDERMRSMKEERSRLSQEYRHALSKEFIAAHDITRDQVISSSAPELPGFYRIDKFAKWLSQDITPLKPWVEWNGRIYATSEILRGCLTETPAIFDDVQ